MMCGCVCLCAFRRIFGKWNDCHLVGDSLLYNSMKPMLASQNKTGCSWQTYALHIYSRGYKYKLLSLVQTHTHKVWRKSTEGMTPTLVIVGGLQREKERAWTRERISNETPKANTPSLCVPGCRLLATVNWLGSDKQSSAKWMKTKEKERKKTWQKWKGDAWWRRGIEPNLKRYKYLNQAVLLTWSL